jgi:hypothetical protein
LKVHHFCITFYTAHNIPPRVLTCKYLIYNGVTDIEKYLSNENRTVKEEYPLDRSIWFKINGAIAILLVVVGWLAMPQRLSNVV